LTNILKAAPTSAGILFNPFAFQVAWALRVEMASKLPVWVIEHKLATNVNVENEV
jgi:hypothetical protein